MSASTIVWNFYQKHAPRWIKVIRWKEHGQRFVENQKFLGKFLYVPVAVLYNLDFDKFPTQLYLRRPQSEEEILELKRNYMTRFMPFQQNWQINEFDIDLKPVYDLSERRLKYPEYYAGRYEAEKKKIPNIWGIVPDS